MGAAFCSCCHPITQPQSNNLCAFALSTGMLLKNLKGQMVGSFLISRHKLIYSHFVLFFSFASLLEIPILPLSISLNHFIQVSKCVYKWVCAHALREPQNFCRANPALQPFPLCLTRLLSLCPFRPSPPVFEVNE